MEICRSRSWLQHLDGTLVCIVPTVLRLGRGEGRSTVVAAQPASTHKSIREVVGGVEWPLDMEQAAACYALQGRKQ
jgi:hypothetical protein